ncbi:MAG TPA: hypothetical protein PLE19_10180 [Planctomycetota bacterium]|nr:hypothetical protein [Planctomycetota bacterium]HRR81002.1 hypothetical protein [Planctomycetota bacterium]HRT93640.1 hypothetical protein [Planctomycetota bacterium]
MKSADPQVNSPSGREWVAAGLVLAAFCGLVLWGLAWGIPSTERARLDGSVQRARELSPELLQKSWQIWGSRGRRSPVAEMYPRHLFNPLRSYHPDEYQVFKTLSNMRPGRLDFDPKNYIYPALHTYLVGAAEGICHLLGAVRIERNVGFYFDHPDELGRMYLVGRALTLLAAAGALAVSWRLGASMAPGVGLIAMGLLAAMPAFAVHSHHLTRDTLTALAALAFFGCCRRVARTGAARWFDFAGVAAGLCVGCQYFAAPLWVMVPLAGVLWYRREGDSKRALAGGVAASLVVMAAVFALTNPYHLLRADQFLADFSSETVHVAHGGPVDRALSLSWAMHLPEMLPSLVTWPVVVVIAVGVVWALVRRQADDWLLLAWVLVWAGVVGFDGRAYSRYYVGLLPALALIGARGLVATWGFLQRLVPIAWARMACAAAVLAVVFGWAGAMTFAWCELYATENVRTVAGEWIARHLPRGARIGVTEWPWQYEMPPLDPAKYRLVAMEDSPRQLPHDLQRLWHEKPDYFVTSNLQFGRMPGKGKPRNEAERFWQFLLGGDAYRAAKEFSVPHRFLGADLMSLPEDLRYVNPIICVLERRVREARGPRLRPTL